MSEWEALYKTKMRFTSESVLGFVFPGPSIHYKGKTKKEKRKKKDMLSLGFSLKRETTDLLQPFLLLRGWRPLRMGKLVDRDSGQLDLLKG